MFQAPSHSFSPNFCLARLVGMWCKSVYTTNCIHIIYCGVLWFMNANFWIGILCITHNGIGCAGAADMRWHSNGTREPIYVWRRRTFAVFAWRLRLKGWREGGWLRLCAVCHSRLGSAVAIDWQCAQNTCDTIYFSVRNASMLLYVVCMCVRCFAIVWVWLIFVVAGAIGIFSIIVCVCGRHAEFIG